ncbi:MAG: DNA polymerase III subunit gamma/tau [Bacteroidota bacterium]
MENFVVSARKYRPLGFGEVVGQEHITTTLENAINSNHLGQALLFCGPRGVGKTTCARILARKINDFDAEDAERTSNFNVFELDAASNNSVDDIRNLIDQVRYPPQQGNYKVYIIDEVHMLSTQAFNAFLKTLEEPPEYAIFILATTEKHRVIPTILSRCQIYDFNRIEIKDIVLQLEKIARNEKVETESEALHLIAQKADGALRDALSIFDLITTFSSDGKISYEDTIKNLHILDHDYYFKLVDDLLAESMAGALILFDEILRNGFDGSNFLSGFQQHLRNLLVAKDEQTVQLLEVADNLKEKYFTQATNCSPSFLLSALNISNQFELNYKQSKNQRLHVELCLMKLAHLPNALSLSSTENGAKKKKPHSELETGSSTSVDGSQRKESTHQNAAVSRLEDEASNKYPVPSNTHPIINIQEPEAKSQTDTPRIFNRKKVKKESANKENQHFFEKKKEPFTEETLQEAWKKFGRKKNDVGDADRLILNREVGKGEGHGVIIHLASQLEVSFLEKLEVELTQFFRLELKNDHIVLSTKIMQEVGAKKLYTSKDIFNHMLKENPRLKDLKDRLGLDFDY